MKSRLRKPVWGVLANRALTIGVFWVALILGSHGAWAQTEGTQLGLGFSYIKVGTNNGSSDSSDLYQPIDIRLGYQMSSGLYLGLLYMSDRYEFKSGSTTTAGSLTGYGPTIGYSNGIFLAYSYVFSTDYTVGSTNYTGGTGSSIDLGYFFDFGRISFGPTLAIRSFTYKKQNGATLAADYKVEHTWPYLNFRFQF